MMPDNFPFNKEGLIKLIDQRLTQLGLMPCEHESDRGLIPCKHESDRMVNCDDEFNTYKKCKKCGEFYR